MTDSYHIENALEDTGCDYALGETVLKGTGWVVDRITYEEVAFKHPSGVVIEIQQRKPELADLPFRVIRVTPAGDEFQLGEGDWVSQVIPIAEAYMYGYSEYHTQ